MADGLNRSTGKETKPTVGSGKFEQINNAIPFNGIRDALEQILKRVISSHTRSVIVQTLRVFLNDFTIQILADQLVPGMKELFGDINCPVMVLSAFENRMRLEDGLGRWLQAMCSLCEPYPPVIILDDLQWITESTASLLKSMIFNEKVSILYLITFRPVATEPLDSCYPVHLLQQEIEKKDDILLYHILLKELELQDSMHLISDSMGTTNNLQSLAEIIHSKTSGNPFFVNQVSSMDASTTREKF